MLYFLRETSTGGILCSNEQPQVRRKGLGAGMSLSTGDRFQIASVKTLANKFNDAEVMDAYQSYIKTLKEGDKIEWAKEGKKNVSFRNDEGEQVELSWKWAVVDLNKVLDTLEEHVEVVEEA